MALTKVTSGGISDIAAAVEGASDSNKFTDADHTKLNGVAASANNYVHPNHSGDVVSAADGAMTIQTDAVDIAMLSATGTASNTTFLRGDNAWATAANISDPPTLHSSAHYCRRQHPRQFPPAPSRSNAGWPRGFSPRTSGVGCL